MQQQIVQYTSQQQCNWMTWFISKMMNDVWRR